MSYDSDDDDDIFPSDYSETNTNTNPEDEEEVVIYKNKFGDGEFDSEWDSDDDGNKYEKPEAYKEMLRCDPVFFLLSQTVLDYLQQRRNDFGAAAIVAFRMLQVLYYKPHQAYDAMRKHEIMERRRQMPYHMHINLELLDAVHLICAMLLEVPNMAVTVGDAKGKVISKTFRKLLEESQRRILRPPVKMFSFGFWSFLGDRDNDVLEMLKSKIKEEAMRICQFTYSPCYSSASVDQPTTTLNLSKYYRAWHGEQDDDHIEEPCANWDQHTRHTSTKLPALLHS
ncbi:hypothetical protein IFM89_006116 [Coptis chinensis]|uniref:Eukaryotic translation initiation factor 3 subunit C N-terminal domain-containing protein n=1 Tax=Coptis chinensis TaxID=261450 RepID=A0A835GXT5_9MAGN|nr:hypothetical protein IFM89_006116 [Coptis chinensis]